MLAGKEDVEGAHAADDYDREHGGVDEPYAEAVPMPPPSAPGQGFGGADGGANGARANHHHAAGDDDDIETGAGGIHSAIGKVPLQRAQNVVFANGGYPLLVFFASLVLMISASSTCNNAVSCAGEPGYAVAAGVISMLVSFAFLYLERKENLTAKTRLGLTVFLFIWWVLVAGITTFSSPFTVPGNGYFAAWGGLAGALYMLMNEVGRVRVALDRFSRVGHMMAVLLVGSLVVLFSGVGSCSNGCSGTASYAIAVGAISFIAAALRLSLEHKLGDNVIKVYNLFMVVWWAIAFFILTFVNPFLTVGNGYFGTWACLIVVVLQSRH